jgi:hypothetical protein
VKETDSSANQLHIPSDLTNPEAVINAFDKVKKAFSIPSVVVYIPMATTHLQNDTINRLTFNSQPTHFLAPR